MDFSLDSAALSFARRLGVYQALSKSPSRHTPRFSYFGRCLQCEARTTRGKNCNAGASHRLAARRGVRLLRREHVQVAVSKFYDLAAKTIALPARDAGRSIWCPRNPRNPGTHPIGTAIEGRAWDRKEFSADGSILLSRNGTHARLWDASSGRAIGEPVELQRLGSIPPRDSAVLLSPDGRLLAIGTGDAFSQLVDAHTARPITSQLPHTAAVVALAFSPDSALLLTGSADGMARFWHVATGRPIGPPLEHRGHRVDRVAFRPTAAPSSPGPE